MVKSSITRKHHCRRYLGDIVEPQSYWNKRNPNQPTTITALTLNIWKPSFVLLWIWTGSLFQENNIIYLFHSYFQKFFDICFLFVCFPDTVLYFLEEFLYKTDKILSSKELTFVGDYATNDTKEGPKVLKFLSAWLNLRHGFFLP